MLYGLGNERAGISRWGGQPTDSQCSAHATIGNRQLNVLAIHRVEQNFVKNLSHGFVELPVAHLTESQTLWEQIINPYFTTFAVSIGLQKQNLSKTSSSIHATEA